MDRFEAPAGPSRLHRDLAPSRRPSQGRAARPSSERPSPRPLVSRQSGPVQVMRRAPVESPPEPSANRHTRIRLSRAPPRRRAIRPPLRAVPLALGPSADIGTNAASTQDVTSRPLHSHARTPICPGLHRHGGVCRESNSQRDAGPASGRLLPALQCVRPDSAYTAGPMGATTRSPRGPCCTTAAGRCRTRRQDRGGSHS